MPQGQILEQDLATRLKRGSDAPQHRKDDVKHEVSSLPEASALSTISLSDEVFATHSVTGWSFGGYFAAMATIRRPDVFRCGVAGAPVVTWEDYDTHYTERYLGVPPAAAYRVSNVTTYATQLERPLLLIHGLTDDNVYFQHTLQLANALFLAGKHFELLPMLGTHMAAKSDPIVGLREQLRVIEFFNRELRP